MMTKTKVVHCKKDDYDVYIGRGKDGKVALYPDYGWLGNPFTEGTRKEKIDKFRKYFHNRLKNDTIFKLAVDNLKGKTLGCWCKPKDCHGDVIAQYLNKDSRSVVF